METRIRIDQYTPHLRTRAARYLRHRKYWDNGEKTSKSFSSEHEHQHELQAVSHFVTSIAPPGGSTLTKSRTKDPAFSSWYSLQHLERCLCKRLTFSPFKLLFILPWFLQEQGYGEVLYFSTPLMGLLFPKPFPLLLVVGGAAESDPNNQIRDKFNPLNGKKFSCAASHHRSSESNVSKCVMEWISEWVSGSVSNSVIEWVSLRVNQWKKWMAQWMSRSVIQSVNESVCKWVHHSELLKLRVSEWVSQLANDSATEWVT